MNRIRWQPTMKTEEKANTDTLAKMRKNNSGQEKRTRAFTKMLCHLFFLQFFFVLVSFITLAKATKCE